MLYDKEIPDYAMVPAKEVKDPKEPAEIKAKEESLLIPITKGAIYSPLQLTNISEKKKTTIVIEEDILVPDTKPDMKEILLVDGKVRITTGEISNASRNEDYLNLSGEIELQTLYLPETSECSLGILSVQSRLPFREQWHIDNSQGGVLTIRCRTEKTEYMIVNERKFRVRITLAVFAREYAEIKTDVFEGISGEDICMLKEKIEISNLAVRKKDSLSISENLMMKEESGIESILKQDIYAIENYKQMTNDRLVINGFICVNLLYTTINDGVTDEDCNIRQSFERVEFTQFIPLRYEGECAGSSICLDTGNLRVKVVRDEEGEVLRLDGELVTQVEVFTDQQKEIIIDAYHMEKEFICDFKQENSRIMLGTAIGEVSIREILSPENPYGEIDKILYTSVGVCKSQSSAEAGKIVTEGTVLAKIICRSSKEEDNECAVIYAVNEEIPFRIVTAMPQAEGGEIVTECVQIKDFRAEKINGKQIELNAVILASADVMKEVLFKLPLNPAFEEHAMCEEKPRMVVYTVKGEDSLWGIAKHFKTTIESIKEVNELEENSVRQGECLLILR